MPTKRSRPDRSHRRRERRPEARVVLVYELVGTVLGIYRRRAELIQGDLAELLDWPKSLVSKVERGDVGISLNQFDHIIEVLDAELQDFGDQPALLPWDVMEKAYAIGDSLMEDGYDLVWSTGLSWERPEVLVRGRDLLELIRARWNVE